MLLSAAIVSKDAFAQAGSEGGSIGGTIAAPPPASAQSQRPMRKPHRERAPRPQAAAGAPHRQAERRGGGYDGTWNVTSGGCGATGTSQVMIAGGRISGQGGGGTVSPGGIVHTVGSVNGMIVRGSGRISGATASGTYHRSDGCSGPWSAYKL